MTGRTRPDAAAEAEAPADPRRIEYRPLGGLIADPRNPKAHAGEAIGASVTRFGFVEPIVVDERTGFIASGHGRAETLQAMCKRGEAPPAGVKVTSRGEWLVPVVAGYASRTDSEAGAALIALNRTTELGGWVDEALLDLLEDIDRDAAVGFDDDALEALRTQVAQAGFVEPEQTDPDEVPARRAKPRSRLGDVWALGEHRLVVGDATDAAAYEALLGGKRADLMWTDPPYGVDYVGKTADAMRIEGDDAAGLSELLRSAFPLAVAALRPGAPVYVAHADTERVTFELALRAAGVLVRQNLIWAKNTMVLGRSDYHYRHEPILYGFTPAGKGQGRLGRGGRRWYGDNAQVTLFGVEAALGARHPITLGDLCRAILDGSADLFALDPVELVEALLGGEASASTVFEVAKPAASREHPTMKPTALVAAMLRNSAKPGDVVLDPFAGSGTTLIAADQVGARARLLELDPVYADVIVDRWEAVTGGKAKRAKA